MNIIEWIDICMSKGRETNLMKESSDFSVSIKTLKKELPETSQIGIGEEACLFSIKYDGNDDKFSKPIRLVGNVLVFCVKGSVHMSVNLNEYDVKEGSLMILTDQDIVKVEKGSDDEIKNLHWVMIAMSQNFLSDLRVDFKKILSKGVTLLETPVIQLNQEIRGYFEDYLRLIGKLADNGTVTACTAHCQKLACQCTYILTELNKALFFYLGTGCGAEGINGIVCILLCCPLDEGSYVVEISRLVDHILIHNEKFLSIINL